MTRSDPQAELPASTRIDEKMAALTDWRGAALARVRALILAATPGVTEEWKWSTPVWSLGGVLCTGEVYRAAVKLTFPRGAALPDPTGLFNASLDGKVRRALDLREGASFNEAAFQDLVRAAATLNEQRVGPRGRQPGKG
ncbi:DUF1801 domain-containing protein [Deinococcus arcticus]|uniref:YdhG-like domain-containing protein n=1 Tax=Deinococcus arcticus TaxID=2136176 RepID=A0A2T3W5M8_9DEIO|nr:DUF1801 domain-containing protein [Deinococcus arcticus]PTA67206.1 hypothetical protein C8263_14010 [Deinococcus arcticus]